MYLQHPFSVQNPTDIPKHVFALAHCLNKPTGKHTEITDNRRVRKPSTLTILSSSVSFITYLRSSQHMQDTAISTLSFTEELSVLAL